MGGSPSRLRTDILSAGCKKKYSSGKVAMAKEIASILPTSGFHWVGDGFHVTPLFGDLAFTRSLSPFLMLDYAAPENFPATKRRRGVGQHPHRGFETVTLAYNGEVSHADSTGMKDTIFPGDVQWMTAASGIFHEEFHSEEFAKKGGTFEMVQLWVDLPADLKMSPPKYQPLRAADFPTVALSARSSVRVIAGSLHGVTGTANTHTPMHLWDVKIAAGEAVELPVESGFNTMFFVRSGQVYIDSKKYGKKTIEPARLVVFEQDGSSVRMEATQNTELLFLSGQPLDQPIAARGPFVMCTQQELREAMIDFQNGNLVRHK